MDWIGHLHSRVQRLDGLTWERSWISVNSSHNFPTVRKIWVHNSRAKRFSKVPSQEWFDEWSPGTCSKCFQVFKGLTSSDHNQSAETLHLALGSITVPLPTPQSITALDTWGNKKCFQLVALETKDSPDPTGATGNPGHLVRPLHNCSLCYESGPGEGITRHVRLGFCT